MLLLFQGAQMLKNKNGENENHLLKCVAENEEVQLLCNDEEAYAQAQAIDSNDLPLENTLDFWWILKIWSSS